MSCKSSIESCDFLEFSKKIAHNKKESQVSLTLSSICPQTYTPISRNIILLVCEICKPYMKFFRVFIREAKSGWMTIEETEGSTVFL